MNDPFDLARFAEAQKGVYRSARAEIAQGRKRGHWMWFIFPQFAGLGRSEMARRYAIGTVEEARAYLAHPVLGKRLRDCVTALQDLPTGTADDIFGHIDALKLRSCLTLFIAAGGGPLFDAALMRWFGGEADENTLDLIR